MKVFVSVVMFGIAVAAHAETAQRPVTSERDVVAACHESSGYAQGFGGRRTFLWSPKGLEAGRAQAIANPRNAAYLQLLVRADAALQGPTYSVVSKTRTPPSGDKHDYMSMGPYWWPDPQQPHGAPYIRRDGKVNPERSSSAFDIAALDAFSAAVEALGLAFYLTDDRRYADKTGELLRAWFLDPATRMKPNANFAQGIPGRVDGRAEGVLDTFRLMPVIEVIGLLTPSTALTPKEQEELKRWFDEYVTWMSTSAIGTEERDAANNHGLWYDAQVAHFALFAGREAVARQAIERTRARLIAQIETDGRMPHELGRTRALHYSIFALQAAVRTADLGRCLGEDLWTSGPQARKLHAAVDFLMPYVGREHEFPFPELNPHPSEEALELFARAHSAFGAATYAAAVLTLIRHNERSELNLTVVDARAAGGGG
jgi:hypothetical protein